MDTGKPPEPSERRNYSRYNNSFGIVLLKLLGDLCWIGRLNLLFLLPYRTSFLEIPFLATHMWSVVIENPLFLCQAMHVYVTM